MPTPIAAMPVGSPVYVAFDTNRSVWWRRLQPLLLFHIQPETVAVFAYAYQEAFLLVLATPLCGSGFGLQINHDLSATNDVARGQAGEPHNAPPHRISLALARTPSEQ